MAGYDAYELGDRIEKALMGNDGRDGKPVDKRFEQALKEAFHPDDPPEPTIFFQDTGATTPGPSLAIDIVEATRTPEFGEGVDDYQYTVYCTVSRTLQDAAQRSHHVFNDPDDPNAIVQGSQVECARTMRAVERFFATQLQPTDGFVLLSIESIVSGSFADDGTTRALSTLQMQIVLTE